MGTTASPYDRGRQYVQSEACLQIEYSQLAYNYNASTLLPNAACVHMTFCNKQDGRGGCRGSDSQNCGGAARQNQDTFADGCYRRWGTPLYHTKMPTHTD